MMIHRTLQVLQIGALKNTIAATDVNADDGDVIKTISTSEMRLDSVAKHRRSTTGDRRTEAEETAYVVGDVPEVLPRLKVTPEVRVTIRRQIPTTRVISAAPGLVVTLVRPAEERVTGVARRQSGDSRESATDREARVDAEGPNAAGVGTGDGVGRRQFEHLVARSTRMFGPFERHETAAGGCVTVGRRPFHGR